MPCTRTTLGDGDDRVVERVVEVDRLRLAEAGAADEQLERRGHDEEAARAELRVCKVEERDEVRRREMLEQLDRRHRPERRVLAGCEGVVRRRLLDLEALGSRERDHVGVRIGASGLDAALAQEREQLPSTAAEVEHRRVISQPLDVRTLTVAHLVDRPAQSRLEREVVGQRGCARLRRDGLRRGRGRTPFEPQHVHLLQDGFAITLTEPVAKDVDKRADRLTIVLDDVTNPGSDALTGIGTGMTFGLVGSEVTNGFVFTVTYERGSTIATVKVKLTSRPS